MHESEQIKNVMDFWFLELTPDHWFKKSATLDREIKDRFLPLWKKAFAGDLDDWRQTPAGSLAHCLVLDQFPRNMFRGTAKAFASDEAALTTTKSSVERGFDMAADLTDHHRQFLYMSLMHSENLADQEECVRLARENVASPRFLDYAVQHRDIIARFGRFPHRNEILGRESTAQEKAFLASGKGSF